MKTSIGRIVVLVVVMAAALAGKQDGTPFLVFQGQYHLPTCTLVAQMAFTWATVQEVAAKEYQACQVCRPDRAPEWATYRAKQEAERKKAAAAAAAAAPSGTVYASLGIYHRFNCPLNADMKASPMTARSAGAAHLVACSTCKPDDDLAVADEFGLERYSDVSYVTSTIAAIRSESGATTKIVGQAAALEIFQILNIKPGWVRVRNARTIGWLQGDAANVLPRDATTALATKSETQAGWPTATVLDILRMKPRVGFTDEQVRLALGDPISVTSDETATGVTVTMVYTGRSIILTGGKVTRIITREK